MNKWINSLWVRVSGCTKYLTVATLQWSQTCNDRLKWHQEYRNIWDLAVSSETGDVATGKEAASVATGSQVVKWFEESQLGMKLKIS